MAITFDLVARGSNHLVYLASSDGTTAAFDTGTIQGAGVGDADVALRDACIPGAGDHWNAGLLKQVLDIEQPVGPSLSGVAARQLLDWGLGGPPAGFASLIKVPGKRLRAYFVPILPTGGEVLKNWSVVAAFDGDNVPEYGVTATAAGAARALIVIEAIGTPQQF